MTSPIAQPNETHRNRPAWRAALAVWVVGLCVVVFCMGWGGARWADVPGGLSLARAWGDSQFRFFACVVVGSLTAIAALAGLLLRAGRRACRQAGRRPDGEDGTAIIEFALVLPIALVIVLLMIQSSMLMGGYLCVNYASYCATRAAVTYIPAEVGDEEPNVVADESDPEISEKLSRMHQAAAWAVMPIGDGAYEQASPYSDVLVEGLESLLARYDRSSWPALRDRLGRKLAYAEQNTAVVLSPPSDGIRYAEHEDLTVTVRHNLYLSVPYAGLLLARLDSEHAVDFAPGRYALWVEIPCTLTNEGVSDRIELEPTTNPTQTPGGG
jgi:hypothetical protein